MPKGTEVDNVYQEMLRQGKNKASAARIAQSITGMSLKTGKKPKKKTGKRRGQ
jgi:nicotinamide mononucleotide (NMN) deamidase PncC